MASNFKQPLLNIKNVSSSLENAVVYIFLSVFASYLQHFQLIWCLTHRYSIFALILLFQILKKWFSHKADILLSYLYLHIPFPPSKIQKAIALVNIQFC